MALPRKRTSQPRRAGSLFRLGGRRSELWIFFGLRDDSPLPGTRTRGAAPYCFFLDARSGLKLSPIYTDALTHSVTQRFCLSEQKPDAGKGALSLGRLGGFFGKENNSLFKKGGAADFRRAQAAGRLRCTPCVRAWEVENGTQKGSARETRRAKGFSFPAAVV